MEDKKIEVFGITPDEIRIEHGKPIMYILMHPDDRPIGRGWTMQRRRDGFFSLWRKTVGVQT